MGPPESPRPPRTVSHPGRLGTTHPGLGPSRLSPTAKDRLQSWGVAWLCSPAQEAGLGYFCFSLFLYFSHPASQIFWLTWPHLRFAGCECTARWACPTRSLSGGSEAPASMDLRFRLNCGSSAAVRLSTRSQPARLPGPACPLCGGRCLRGCASPRGQAQPHSGPSRVQFQ